VGLPKRRHSKSRRNKRRANWKLQAPGYTPCPQCKSPRLPHRACPSCGSYAGRTAAEIKTKESGGSAA